VVLTNDVLAKMKEEITSPPSAGVYVYGLFLEGAAWSRSHSRLTESKAKILFDPMPVMHISATSGTDSSANQASGGGASGSSQAANASKIMNYSCPIYKKPKRTDRTFIATVNLRTNVSPDIWVLRGACLLCDTK
jgi:dynein heavy chain, axonemal